MYRKEVIYMGLYKNGNRMGSAGFLKVENKERESRLHLKVQNVPLSINGRFPIRVYNGSDWKEINGITVQDGGGNWVENMSGNVEQPILQVMLPGGYMIKGQSRYASEAQVEEQGEEIQEQQEKRGLSGQRKAGEYEWQVQEGYEQQRQRRTEENERQMREPQEERERQQRRSPEENELPVREKQEGNEQRRQAEQVQEGYEQQRERRTEENERQMREPQEERERQQRRSPEENELPVREKQEGNEQRRQAEQVQEGYEQQRQKRENEQQMREQQEERERQIREPQEERGERMRRTPEESKWQPMGAEAGGELAEQPGQDSGAAQQWHPGNMAGYPALRSGTSRRNTKINYESMTETNVNTNETYRKTSAESRGIRERNTSKNTAVEGERKGNGEQYVKMPFDINVRRDVGVKQETKSPQTIIITEELPRRNLNNPDMTFQKTTEYHLKEDKWEQILDTYEQIHPYGDERVYVKIEPKDFVILQSKYQHLVNNSFLLHGFYNYRYIILGREQDYYLGVPGVFYEREKMVALMFGFEAFECPGGNVQAGEFGYYLRKVEL